MASKPTVDSPSVHTSLSILQNVITRMAGNSANVKTWCVGLVSAILVILIDKNAFYYAWIAIIPILLFFMLDTYYLALEKAFRNRYNQFIKKLHQDECAIEDLFVVFPPRQKPLSIKNYGLAIISPSVWPFYIMQIVILFVASSIFNHSVK